jgi:hypothetical protein
MDASWPAQCRFLEIGTRLMERKFPEKVESKKLRVEEGGTPRREQNSA